MSKTKFVQKKTERLFNKAKLKRFTDIFKILDSDGDGVISPKYMSAHKIMALDMNLLKIMKPIFDRMEKDNLTLELK